MKQKKEGNCRQNCLEENDNGEYGWKETRQKAREGEDKIDTK